MNHGDRPARHKNPQKVNGQVTQCRVCCKHFLMQTSQNISLGVISAISYIYIYIIKSTDVYTTNGTKLHSKDSS